MIGAQRRQVILEILQAEGAVEIAALTLRLDASAVTVRRDLDRLEAEGCLTRTHGGAVTGTLSRESPYAEKVRQVMTEKRAIGAAAAALVRDGDTIVVGPGTTTEELAKRLVERSALTVITNSLPVAHVFAGSPENQVILAGGALRGSIFALVGEMANRMLGGVRADTVFLSGNGLTPDFGLSTPNLAVADADRAMAAASGRVVVLADHTKIGRTAALQTVPSAGIAELVTDAAASSECIEEFRTLGVTVHVAAD